MRKQLRALKDQGVVALARVEREMLIKASEGGAGMMGEAQRRMGRVALAKGGRHWQQGHVCGCSPTWHAESLVGCCCCCWSHGAGLQVIQDFKVQLQEDFAAHQQQLAREAEERARARAKLEAQVGRGPGRWGRRRGNTQGA